MLFYNIFYNYLYILCAERLTSLSSLNNFYFKQYEYKHCLFYKLKHFLKTIINIPELFCCYKNISLVKEHGKFFLVVNSEIVLLWLFKNIGKKYHVFIAYMISFYEDLIFSYKEVYK